MKARRTLLFWSALAVFTAVGMAVWYAAVIFPLKPAPGAGTRLPSTAPTARNVAALPAQKPAGSVSPRLGPIGRVRPLSSGRNNAAADQTAESAPDETNGAVRGNGGVHPAVGPSSIRETENQPAPHPWWDGLPGFSEQSITTDNQPILAQGANGPAANPGQTQGTGAASDPGRRALLAMAVEATDISASTVPTVNQVEENALRAAGGQTNDPTAPQPSGTTRTIETTTAMAQILRSFFDATDPERKQDLLAVAQDLSTNSAEDIRPLLEVALGPGQPLEVRRQALYLATLTDLRLVQTVASIRSHPLQDDAQAFLLESQLANGVTAPPMEEPAGSSSGPSSP